MTRYSTAPKAAARLSLRIKPFPYHMIPPYSYPLKRPTNTIHIWDIHWIVPCGYAAKDILTQFGLTELKTFHLSDTKMLEHIFRKMHNALRTDSIFGNYKASGYLYDFLMEFYRLIAYKDPATSPTKSCCFTTPCSMKTPPATSPSARPTPALREAATWIRSS